MNECRPGCNQSAFGVDQKPASGGCQYATVHICTGDAMRRRRRCCMTFLLPLAGPGHHCRRDNRACDRDVPRCMLQYDTLRIHSRMLLPCRLHARLSCPSAQTPLLSQSRQPSVARQCPCSGGQLRQRRGLRCRSASEPDPQDGALRPTHCQCASFIGAVQG